MKEIKEHFSAKALVGTAIVVLAVVIGNSVYDKWVKPMVMSGSVTPPATA